MRSLRSRLGLIDGVGDPSSAPYFIFWEQRAALFLWAENSYVCLFFLFVPALNRSFYIGLEMVAHAIKQGTKTTLAVRQIRGRSLKLSAENQFLYQAKSLLPLLCRPVGRRCLQYVPGLSILTADRWREEQWLSLLHGTRDISANIYSSELMWNRGEPTIGDQGPLRRWLAQVVWLNRRAAVAQIAKEAKAVWERTVLVVYTSICSFLEIPEATVGIAFHHRTVKKLNK